MKVEILNEKVSDDPVVKLWLAREANGEVRLWAQVEGEEADYLAAFDEDGASVCMVTDEHKFPLLASYTEEWGS